MFRLISATLAIWAALAGAARAEDDALRLAGYGDWSVFVDRAAGVCWAATLPEDTGPGGETYLMVSIWADDPANPELSYYGNGPLLGTALIRLRVGRQKADLYNDGNIAWLATEEEDARIVAAMRVADEVALIGHASDGTPITERFFLDGFGAALDDAARRCEEAS